MRQSACTLFLLLLDSIVSQVSALTMNSVGRIMVLDEGDSATLECWFSADQFNLFNHPVLWRKRQWHEDNPVNIMSNLHEPFMATGRFAATFTSTDSEQHFELKIDDVQQEDSGNYTCEIRGPHAILLGHVSYILHIRAFVDTLYMTTSNLTSDYGSSWSLQHAPPTQIVTLVDTQMTTIRCVSTGSYQSPEMSMYLDGRDVTDEFSLRYSTELSGERGLRKMRFTTELFSYTFSASSADNRKKLKCIVAVPGLPANSTSVFLNIHHVPQFSCSSSSASLSDLRAVVTCTIRANPPVTSSYWIIDDNDTVLQVGDIFDNRIKTVIGKQDDEGAVQQSLIISHVAADSFRQYSLVAENSVGSSTCFVTLHREFKASSQVKVAPPVNLTQQLYSRVRIRGVSDGHRLSSTSVHLYLLLTAMLTFLLCTY